MAIKNDQYNQILRDYDKRQFDNKREQNQRIKEIYKAIPEIKNLDDQMITISAQSGRLAIMGDTSSLDNLKNKVIDLEARKIELLVSNGYPANYMDMHYDCNKCMDTGYIDNEKCTCFKQAFAQLISSDSNLNEIIKKENFSTFSYSYYPNDYTEETTGLTPLANIKKIVADCKSFIKDFDKKDENILFLGNTGVGKTFLTNCIAKELLDKGYTVIYLTAFRLFDILEKYKFGKNTSDTHIAASQFDYILNCDLLIIDDLGTEMNNSFTSSQLYLIINERLLKRLSTIISTNLSLEQLDSNYSERIYSRIISSYNVCKIVGGDIRLQKALGN